MNFTEAKIVADSVNSYNEQRITTFEVTLPRIILAELNTHKLASKSYSSSRAIPFTTMIENTDAETFVPYLWGKNKSGMAASDYFTREESYDLEQEWLNAYESVKKHAKALADRGVHKQTVNRLLEPFQYVKGLITSTDYSNFFWLRLDQDAVQPEMYHLAKLMYDAYEKSEPRYLNQGEWHIPYFTMIGDNQYQCSLDGVVHNLDDAKLISVSLAAQRSYRKEDTSLEKAMKVYDVLTKGDKLHASAFEHIATPIFCGFNQTGVTHMYKGGEFCSGNLTGWVQLRHLLGEQGLSPHHRSDV